MDGISTTDAVNVSLSIAVYKKGEDMAILNAKTNNTEKNVHLMVTNICLRDCKYCCNKQYDLNSIPYVTDEELKQAENIFITGGEPFAFAQPENIARLLKNKYHNIKNIFVYTNAKELWEYVVDGGSFDHIDGLTVSVKNKNDMYAVNEAEVLTTVKNMAPQLKSNWLYVFPGLGIDESKLGNFIYKTREWQKEFTAASDSIFRKF